MKDYLSSQFHAGRAAHRRGGGPGALAGCSGGSDGPARAPLRATTLPDQTIKDRGELNCGVKADVLGYGYLNTETNEYEGLEIDLCYQIAAAVLGISYEEAKEKKLCEFTTVTPQTRGTLIDNDYLDIVCATYTITPEREEDWDFSTPTAPTPSASWSSRPTAGLLWKTWTARPWRVHRLHHAAAC